MQNRKKLLLALLLGAAVAFTSTVAIASGHTVIDSQELMEMIEDGEPMVIVDVREPRLYSAGHIPGAVNIPYDGARERVAGELPRDKKVVFVCHGGPMGDELSGVLLEGGFTNVYNLGGGMRRWRGPLER